MDGDAHTTRERLIRAVERGEMRKADAEAKAAELGLGALLPLPRPELFNPETKARWSLLMAVIWVLTRNIEAVRNSWNDYVVTLYRWEQVSPILDSWHAKRRAPQWLHQVSTDRFSELVFEQSPGKSFFISWTLLRLACADGAVKAWGRDLRRGPLSDVEAIPALNWDAAEVGELPPEHPLPVAGEDALYFGDGQAVYSAVVVDRAGLMLAFPLVEGAHSPTVTDPLGDSNNAQDSLGDMTPMHRAIADAIKRKWETGLPQFPSIKARDKALLQAVRENTGDESIEISPDTFSRYFSKYGAAKERN